MKKEREKREKRERRGVGRQIERDELCKHGD